MKDKITFEDSVKAANLEFKEEPMDENYSNLIVGYPSRLRVKKILQGLGDINGKLILDAGCEAGHVSIKLMEKGADVTAVDIVEPALEKFREKIKNTKYKPKIMNAAIQHLPFKHDTFDAVVCTETLEHAPNTKKCISELYRVIKPGGKIIITIPIEKNRKLLYPIAKLLGVNTSVEDQVTLYDLSMTEIMKITYDLDFSVRITEVIPKFFPLTNIFILTKSFNSSNDRLVEWDV